MNKPIIGILMGIFLLASFTTLQNVSASSWDNDPHENISKDKLTNESHKSDYNKHKVIRQKAFGYSQSKICGLELCPHTKKDTPSVTFMKGIDAKGGLSKSAFDGKVYLKGFNQYIKDTKSTNSTK